MKFDFDDILIEAAASTNMQSRKTINPFTNDGFLPIITAPMDTVVNSDNEYTFIDNKINVCLPRGENRNIRTTFESYSLEQFRTKYLEPRKSTNIRTAPIHVLIDTANGHTRDLENTVKRAKSLYGQDLVLMVGNVANPVTYRILSEAGADLIRCGVGNGNSCLTTQQLGVGYPMGSLIEECYEVSCTLTNPAKIIADGGMKKYSDIIKALAIGADYVMIGSILNKALESASKTYNYKTRVEASDKDKDCFINGRPTRLYKKFRGMSTKEVQKDWGNTELKTSEGIVKYQEVEYTIKGWVDNFEHYLRSAMSYTGSYNLSEFIGQVKYNKITNNALNRFTK